MFAVSGHVNKPGVYEVEFGVTTFRDLIYGADLLRRHPRRQRSSRRSSPAARRRRGSSRSTSTCRSRRAPVGKAGSMLGSGAIVVMDETTDVVSACHRIVRFFARESCGKCTPCREGTTWLEQILARIIDGHGRPRTSTCCSTSATTSAPASPGRRRQTTICPLGPSAVSPIASALEPVPRRVRGATSAARSPSTVHLSAARRSRHAGAGSSTGTAPMTDDRSTVTINGRDDRGAPKGELVIDAAERARRLHPALLLPPAHEAGGHVPHVPRRDRHRPRARRCSPRA